MYAFYYPNWCLTRSWGKKLILAGVWFIWLLQVCIYLRILNIQEHSPKTYYPTMYRRISQCVIGVATEDLVRVGGAHELHGATS